MRRLPLPSRRPPDLFDWIVSVGFVVALIVPGIALATGIRPVDLEGRPRASLPLLDASSLGESSTYAAIDRWLADRFPGRNEAVGAHAAIDYGVLGGSTTPNVIVGRDGWLFTRTELEPVCDFTAEQVLAALDRTAAALARRGLDLRLIVPPDKHAMHPEQVVPGSGLGQACSDERRAAMQAGMAARPDHAIELWTRIAARRAADPTVPLYFKQDTHWTPLGAVIATKALVESLAPGVWDDAQMPIEGFANYDTDLSRLIGLPRKERVPRLVVRPGVEMERTVVPTSVDLKSARDIGHYQVDTTAKAVEGRTLIVYDSYFRTNERRIAPWFRDSVWVHADDLKRSPELVADLPAFDRVVVERAERSVYDVDLDALLAPIIAAAS
jgi:SGNH hydrolase-like domain, acetyltransferase AlgX